MMLLELDEKGNPKSFITGETVQKRKGATYADEKTTVEYAKEKGLLTNAVYMDNPETGLLELVANDANKISDAEKKNIDKITQQKQQK